MLFKWVFNYSSESKKIDYLKKQGIVLGSRIRNDRKVYLYLISDFFIEVVYKNDNIDQAPEHLESFSSLENLNAYLESEFRKSF
jgi:hypothetical protein